MVAVLVSEYKFPVAIEAIMQLNDTSNNRNKLT